MSISACLFFTFQIIFTFQSSTPASADSDHSGFREIIKYGLDAQAYNSSDEAVTWENSGLRQWLNDTFYKSAFSEAQREVIIPVINVNPDNERWGTSGGNDTNDTVFLLSIEEAESYFSDRNETLWTQATPYAVAQGRLWRITAIPPGGCVHPAITMTVDSVQRMWITALPE